MSGSGGGGSGGGGGAPPSRTGVQPFRITIPSFQEAASSMQSALPRPAQVIIPPRQPRGPTTSQSSSSNGPSTSSAPRPPPPPYMPRTAISRGNSSNGVGRPPQPAPPLAAAAAGGGGGGGGGSGRPRPPRALNMPSGRHVIAVSERQRGNPILSHIRNVPYEYVEGLVPDYVLGSYTCALYISLRYHLLNPTYLIRRIKELRNDYRLRVVLCQVDVDDNVKPLHEINRLALLERCTLILAWSKEEAARYLETYKALETKPPDSIQERVDSDHAARVSAALTTVRSINKTDAVTLANRFGSVKGIMQATKAELAQCPGLGDKKVQRLFETFHDPFLRKAPAANKRDLPSSYHPLATTTTTAASSSSSSSGPAATGADVLVRPPLSQAANDPLEWGSGAEDDDRDDDDDDDDDIM